MTEEAKNAPEPAEITMLWELFGAEKFVETIDEAERYINCKPDADFYNAKKLIGLSNFRLGNYAESERTFSGLANKTGNLEDWFNLLTSAALNNNTEASEQAFKSIIEIFKEGNESREISLPQIYFYYIQALSDVSQFKIAFTRLSELVQYYIQLKITDSHFLYMRGMPFLADTLKAGKKILENAGGRDAENLLDKLQHGLDEEGKSLIAEFRITLEH